MAKLERSKIGVKHFILIGVNVFVWGYVGYSVFSYGKDESLPVSADYAVPKIKPKSGDSNEYILTLNYPDPFLKEEPKLKNHFSVDKIIVSNAPKRAVIKPVIKTIEIKTHDIKYLGMIQNKTSGSTSTMVSIDGKSYIIKKGDKVNDIVFNNISADNIEVKIGKEKLIISK